MCGHKECELAISRHVCVCVYTASLSQVLYDPWDYSGIRQGYTHTPPPPSPPEEKRGGEIGGREITDQREEGER